MTLKVTQGHGKWRGSISHASLTITGLYTLTTSLAYLSPFRIFSITIFLQWLPVTLIGLSFSIRQLKITGHSCENISLLIRAIFSEMQGLDRFQISKMTSKATRCNRAGHYIFILWFLSFFMAAVCSRGPLYFCHVVSFYLLSIFCLSFLFFLA